VVGDSWESTSLLQHIPQLDKQYQADLERASVNLLTHETHSLQKTFTLPQEETSEQKMVRGVGKQLLAKSAENKFDTALLLVLCNEGDNTPHGIYLAQLVALDVMFKGDNKQLENRQVKWKIPSSWSYLFGPPADSSLY
jgi:hypothetical protein